MDDVTQGPSQKYRNLIGVFILVLAVSLSFTLYFPGNTALVKEPVKGEKQRTPLDERSPDEQLSSLRLNGVVKIPPTKDLAQIQESEFPPELLGFFGTDIRELQTYSARFNEGRTGLVASFFVAKKLDGRGLIGAIAAGATRSSWETLYAIYSKKAALANLENKDHRASIEITMPQDLSANVRITLIKK